MNPVFITFCLGLLLNSCIACEDKFGHSHDDHHPCFNILVARLNRIEARFRGELSLLKDQLKRNPAAQMSADQLEKKITTLKNGINSIIPTSPRTQQKEVSPPSTLVYPTSCVDLYQRGHFLNAFYPVLNKDKIDFIFCDFASQSSPSQQVRASGLETKIGSADVKTSPVYFHVRKNKHLNETGALIPFEVEMMNVGNALNLTSGRFTPPKAGIYQFAYSGVAKNFNFANLAYLVLNGGHQAVGHGTQQPGWRVLTFEAPLKLNVGDRVVLLHARYNGGYLLDNGDHFNGFTGHLVEEFLKL